MWKLRQEYNDSPIYVKGKSKSWVLGGSDIVIPNPPNEDIIREACPEELYESEFVVIGKQGFFYKDGVSAENVAESTIDDADKEDEDDIVKAIPVSKKKKWKRAVQ